MIRRITGQLPAWASREHPILRYELARTMPARSRRNQITRGLVMLLAALLLLGGGYLYATDLLRADAGSTLTEAVWRVLFYPALIVQTALSIAALSMGVNAVASERRRGTWDNLRATEIGADIALRTRWAAVFYRLRIGIGVVMGVRLLLVLGILYDLTSLRGSYLDILTANITPELPVALGVVLLAGLMTALFLMPLAGLGVDAALGLLIAAAFRNRASASVVHIVLVILRVLVVIGLLYAVNGLMSGDSRMSDWLAWLLVSGCAVVGDWGLLLSQLGTAGEIWAIVPYSVFIGAVLLIFTLMQAALADFMLNLAVSRAEVTD